MQSLYPTEPSALRDDDLAELYAYPVERTWVRASLVTTLDGAVQDSDHKSSSLSGAADQRVFALLRSLCDVIVVGAGTVRAEGYQPVQPFEVDADLRASLGLAPVPAIAVVSRSVRLGATLLGRGHAPTIVITTRAAVDEGSTSDVDDVRVIVAGRESVDLVQAIDELAAQGYQRVLCEGGPTMVQQLLARGALDELCLTVSPLLVAGDRLRLTRGPSLEPPTRMRLRHLLEADGHLLCRYTSS